MAIPVVFCASRVPIPLSFVLFVLFLEFITGFSVSLGVIIYDWYLVLNGLFFKFI